MNRLTRSIVEHSLLFFRTSSISRSTPRFLHEARMLPPLACESCVQTLQRLTRHGKLPLEVHFADEEGDPYAVELAGRLGAHVVAHDSDYVILNCDGYAGYIPMESMLWTASEGTTNVVSRGVRSDDFQPVLYNKMKKQPEAGKTPSHGLIPPDVPRTDLTLSLSVYTPAVLALHLKIPVSILPLLASLVGNDFTNQSATQRSIQLLFFERSLSLSQRITRTASTLAGILSTAAQPRKARHRVGSVMDLIDRTVNALLIRSPTHMASGEVDALVDRVASATLQYAIEKYDGDAVGSASLWPTPICALHNPNACPLDMSFRRLLRSSSANGGGDASDDVTHKLGTMYLEAYRAGNLKPKLADILSSNSFWPAIFLENPDAVTVARSIGWPIRRWIYALLEDAVGLGETPEEETARVEGDGGDKEVEEDLNELIDVVEEDSSNEDADPLASLRGELARLRAADDDPVPETPASASSRSRSCRRPAHRPKRVLEYTRQGSRMAAEEVLVPDIAALLSAFPKFSADTMNELYVPFQLRSPEERMSLFLHILESDLPQVRALPRALLLSALVARWIIRTLHLRAVESEMNQTREKERWSRQEARAFLVFCVKSSLDVAEDTPYESLSREDTNVPITDRNVQLMAQVSMAIETIQNLSQVLFLTEQVPVNVERFSGLRFHRYLSDAEFGAIEAVPEGLWEACIQSLDDAFREERSTNKKKARSLNADKVVMQTKRERDSTAMKSKRGRFGLLGDTDG